MENDNNAMWQWILRASVTGSGAHAIVSCCAISGVPNAFVAQPDYR
jgi:hypothetical protein